MVLLFSRLVLFAFCFLRLLYGSRLAWSTDLACSAWNMRFAMLSYGRRPMRLGDIFGYDIISKFAPLMSKGFRGGFTGVLTGNVVGFSITVDPSFIILIFGDDSFFFLNCGWFILARRRGLCSIV